MNNSRFTILTDKDNSSVKRMIIEQEKLIACVPSFLNKNIKTTSRLTPKFYHRSSTELRLIEEQKTKLLTFSTQ